MNQIVIHGRLTRDPEQKAAGSAMISKFTVAANRIFDHDTADFFDCDAFNKNGEFVQKYFTKGQEIIVTGEMQSRKYDDKEGNKRTAWSVNVSNVQFCGSKGADKHSAAESVEVADDSEPEKPLPF